MKTNKLKMMTIALAAALVSANCDNNDNNNGGTEMKDFSGTYVQQDQMARPAINTVFIASGQPKDDFNAAIPSDMGSKYQPIFQSRLMALNPAYNMNALGQSAAAFTGLLATDVLNVSTTKKTTFFDGTNVLTGRALADDVIDVELLLIFGGSAGTSNPQLTSDHVNANDAAFGTSFPYLAAAW
ncbi:MULTISPECIES: DUF4331 family protein [Flavobacterium]|uniref:DUF4331 family protein n=1 Tax=Flavobacterium TaxID=237 RepID=UPI00188C840C|nr:MULTISPECIES: DUF4331 family protein [Flavobacterium]MBF4472600.1 DUF4331 family protein [Flavobacterium sp. HJJ]